MISSRPRLTLASLCLIASLSPLVDAGVLVDLDATSLPVGPLVSWSNNGSVGGAFERDVLTGGVLTDIPNVTTISGVRGVTFDGSNDWYKGPTAPASVTGNGSRTI